MGAYWGEEALGNLAIYGGVPQSYTLLRPNGTIRIMHGVNSKIRQEEETADRDLKGIPKVQGLWQRAVLDPLVWLLYR